LVDIEIISHENYPDVVAGGNDPLYQQIMNGLPQGSTIGDFVTSITLSAVKP
jgi:hypothetical protein